MSHYKMAAEVQEALLTAKKEHPHWGPKKVLPYLAQRRPSFARPRPQVLVISSGATG